MKHQKQNLSPDYQQPENGEYFVALSLIGQCDFPKTPLKNW